MRPNQAARGQNAAAPAGLQGICRFVARSPTSPWVTLRPGLAPCGACQTLRAVPDPASCQDQAASCFRHPVTSSLFLFLSRDTGGANTPYEKGVFKLKFTFQRGQCELHSHFQAKPVAGRQQCRGSVACGLTGPGSRSSSLRTSLSPPAPSLGVQSLFLKPGLDHI